MRVVTADERTTRNPGGPTLPQGQPAAQRVLETLRAMIVKGDLAPGTRIVERTLCAELDVSRTPLREALKMLEIDGLVTLSQNRGGTVRILTLEEGVQLFEVLTILESHGAELAAMRMTDEQMDELRAFHEDMSDAWMCGELPRYFELNTEIHRKLMAATGNAVMVTTYEQLILRAKRCRYMAIANPVRWRQAMAEHESLMHALEKRDATEAGRIWRTHLTHTGQSVAEVLRRSN